MAGRDGKGEALVDDVARVVQILDINVKRFRGGLVFNGCITQL